MRQASASPPSGVRLAPELDFERTAEGFHSAPHRCRVRAGRMSRGSVDLSHRGRRVVDRGGGRHRRDRADLPVARSEWSGFPPASAYGAAHNDVATPGRRRSRGADRPGVPRRGHARRATLDAATSHPWSGKNGIVTDADPALNSRNLVVVRKGNGERHKLRRKASSGLLVEQEPLDGAEPLLGLISMGHVTCVVEDACLRVGLGAGRPARRGPRGGSGLLGRGAAGWARR